MSSAAPQGPSINHDVNKPVIDQDFADPDVTKVGQTYYAYATNSDGRHIKWATSTDLVNWKVQSTDALPTLGAWAVDQGGTTWAPDVSAVGDHFLMYYVAHDRASDKQCIGTATASTPAGPFKAAPASIVCTPDLGGSIDPASFVDGSQHYLVWKNDGNCCAKDTWLRLQPVSADGQSVAGTEVQLVKQDQGFEGALVEAPVIWHHGDQFTLLYSANDYANDSYATGFATASNVAGPYVKNGQPLLSTAAFGNKIHGPGGEDVVVGPDGKDYLVFHGWNAGHNYRAMYLAPLTWSTTSHPLVAAANNN